jgi:hypothetical protein
MTLEDNDIDTAKICRAYNVFLKQRKAAPEPLDACDTPEEAIDLLETARKME